MQRGRRRGDEEKKQPWRPLSMAPSPGSRLLFGKKVALLSDGSKETSQSGGRCHNKQKQRRNPPKSNQDPLIPALNRDWVPRERLIQAGGGLPDPAFPIRRDSSSSFSSHLWTLSAPPWHHPAAHFNFLWPFLLFHVVISWIQGLFRPLLLHSRCSRCFSKPFLWRMLGKSN